MYKFGDYVELQYPGQGSFPMRSERTVVSHDVKSKIVCVRNPLYTKMEDDCVVNFMNLDTNEHEDNLFPGTFNMLRQCAISFLKSHPNYVQARYYDCFSDRWDDVHGTVLFQPEGKWLWCPAIYHLEELEHDGRIIQTKSWYEGDQMKHIVAAQWVAKTQ